LNDDGKQIVMLNLSLLYTDPEVNRTKM